MADTCENQLLERDSLQGDMSYVYGRDPSILSYGQRPLPSKSLKKKLDCLLEDEKPINHSLDHHNTLSDSQHVQTVKVFLRMKPLSPRIPLTTEQSEAYKILNSTTLRTKIPSVETNINHIKKVKDVEILSRNFTFTKTFGPETSQFELFELAVKPQMIDFLVGKNSVVMTYGMQMINSFSKNLSKQ